MSPTVPQPLAEAYSRGEITRRDIEDALGEAVSFGTLLMHLHRYNLPLPRHRSDPNSPGVQLIKTLSEQALRG